MGMVNIFVCFLSSEKCSVCVCMFTFCCIMFLLIRQFILQLLNKYQFQNRYTLKTNNYGKNTFREILLDSKGTMSIKRQELKKKINWRIIALQSCVGFCLMTTWISPKCVCVCVYPLHPGPLSRTLYLTPLGHHRALSWVPCMKVKSEREVAQSCPTLRDPMDRSPPGSSVPGIFQARALEWLPLPSLTAASS